MTTEEEEGVKAIQYLQKVVDIDESDEDALAGWRAMDEKQRQITMSWYNPIAPQEA